MTERGAEGETPPTGETVPADSARSQPDEVREALPDYAWDPAPPSPPAAVAEVGARTLGFLHAHGIEVRPEGLHAMLELAIDQLERGLYPPAPASDLTAAEARVLVRGGLDLRPRETGEENALARTAARYAALLESSLTTAEAAARLGVDPSRVRQRLAEGTLYGIRVTDGWRIPVFQFQGDSLLPGLGEVVSRLPRDLHPVAIFNWFTLPSADLHAEGLGRDLSPREWLLAGYPPGEAGEVAPAL